MAVHMGFEPIDIRRDRSAGTPSSFMHRKTLTLKLALRMGFEPIVSGVTGQNFHLADPRST